MRYLITGATGEIGTRVVQRLLQGGTRPRVLVRDIDKARARFGERVDAVVGDLGDAVSLRRALADVDTLFLANSGPDIAFRDQMAAETAKSAGVRRLVKLSSFDAGENVGTGVWHARGEALIRANGMTAAFVRPSGFMSNALNWSHSIRTEGTVRSATRTGRIAFIHPDDVAEVICETLLRKEFGGEILPITGPEALSYAEMAARIGIQIGRRLRFESMTEHQARVQMLTRGDSPPIVSAHLSIYRAIREGCLSATTDVVARVLGRPPRTFDSWVHDNIAEFQVTSSAPLNVRA